MWAPNKYAYIDILVNESTAAYAIKKPKYRNLISKEIKALQSMLGIEQSTTMYTIKKDTTVFV